MSGIAVGVRERRVVEVPALRVVGRHRADQRELHVGALAAFTSRYASITPSGSFHGSKRETWHSIGRSASIPNCLHTNAASSCESAMFFGASGSIAGGTMFTPPSMPGGHVVVRRGRATRRSAHVGQQALHRRRVGRRDVDVAAPDPALRLLGHEREQRGRLRVVHDAHVPAARELARVHLVVLRPGRPLLVGEVLRVALQRVVHQLRRVEELLAAVDHLPLGVEPDVAHQRDQRVEDLRDAAAERGRATGARRACPSAARPARGSPPPAGGRRCACSRRGSCGRGRRAGARRRRYREARSPAGGRCSGRSPSLTLISRRSPSRDDLDRHLAPGRAGRRRATGRRGRSTGLPSTLVMTSPPAR